MHEVILGRWTHPAPKQLLYSLSSLLLAIILSDEGAVEEQAQDTVKVTDTIVDMDDGIDAE